MDGWENSDPRPLESSNPALLKNPMKNKNPSINLNEEYLLKILEQKKRPLKLKDLEESLHLSSQERKRLKSIVKGLLRKGSLFKLKNRMVGLRQEMNLETGTLWCTRKGNGYVIPDNENTQDIYIPQRFIKDALHGDRVVVRLDHRGKHIREGKILKVLERRTHTVTGFIKRHKNLLYLYPDDERMPHHFVIKDSPEAKGLSDDMLVACRITQFPEDYKEPVCKVVKVFKTLTDVKAISLFITYKYGLPMKFKNTTQRYLKDKRLSINGQEGEDLRSKPFVTIDGEQAKDFDDAVYVEKTRRGFTLYVSIADVSRYVPVDSPLDHEAYERGTSVYFLGSVIPMLPKVLSNDICSLNPDEDRCTVTVELKYDTQGNLTGYLFYPSLIKSGMRLTYTKVEDILVNKKRPFKKGMEHIYGQIEHMAELASILKDKREKRGNIDFDLPEPEIVLDTEGGLKAIIKAPRLFSHRIIEEFMIAANEAVAEFITRRHQPLIYRIHEPPDKEKLITIERLLHTLDMGYGKYATQQLYLQSLLKKVRGTVYEYFINRIILRSMKQAKYSAFNKGHFGLASKIYTHFTSPIRRYPDLVNHRILKGIINGGYLYNEEELERMALHLSDRERIAMEAEREAEDRVRVLFMKDKIGEVFEGIISHITSYGFFVELIDLFIEGLVLLSDIPDDYYIFEEEKFRLTGRRTKKTYRIGDRARVRVIKADVERNQLHFIIATN
ncbi:MAG TPA: ribonuclease R [Deltaproteobacteria bacterium]|nr:ribonuclease R [Deltaproteobacteria bacterium]